MASLQKIDHIVVLMLENRSFDSLLGTLYPKSDSFEGLNGTEQNPDANGTPVVVWNSPGTDETTMRIPNPDPGELWTDINMQLFGNFPNVPTIFNRLEQAGIDSWKIYFHDIAQAHTLLQLFLLGSHFHIYRQFQADCQTGQLPAYSFIEPQYFADFGHPENDQHPPSVVTLGEQLIADVYNCLRASKVWRKTLLLITYDEHGGCYDHVAPSAAVPPQPPVPGQTFGFDRYGVRVPAVIVSPYVAPGTVFGKSSAVPFDHTAIIATVRKRFGISGTLTARDAQAPDLDSVLTLPRPTNLGPLRLKALPYAPSPATAAVAQTKPLNSMQKALVGLATDLPPAPGNNLQTHLANLKATRPQPAPATALASVHDARDYVKRQAGNYFQSH
jgi:phospholipase C